MPKWSEIQKRIGGKRAISWVTFLVATPFWVIGFVLNEDATFVSPRSGMLVLVIALVGQGVMGLVLWIAHLALLRHRHARPTPLSVLIAVWSLSALTRLAVMLSAFEFFGLPNSVPLETRIFVSILLATFGYSFGAYALDAIDRFREQRAKLLSELLASEEQLSQHRAAVDTMKQTLAAHVDERLAESKVASHKALDRLEEALESPSDARVTLEQLRLLSEKTWQNISQELWFRVPAKAPRIRLNEIFALFARSNPFRIAYIGAIAFFLYLVVYSRAYDPLTGLWLVMVWAMGAVIFATITNRVLRALKKSATPVFVVAVVLYLLSSLPLLAFTDALGLTSPEWFRVVGVHAISVLFSIASSLPPTVTEARERVLDGLRQHVDATTMEKLLVESQITVAAQKIANRLHGDVRGNFLASVLKLENHIDKGALEEAKADIAQLRAALQESVVPPPEKTVTRNDVESFLAQWSAIVDIELERPLSEVPDVFLPAVHTVIVDAVNNAVRHTRADWVLIGFTVEPDAVVVDIRNSGHRTSGKRVGLGTVQLNLLAPNLWQLIDVKNGITQLIVRLERDNVTHHVSAP